MGGATIADILGIADKIGVVAGGALFVWALARRILVFGWQYRELERRLTETERRLAQWEGVAFTAVTGQSDTVEVTRRALDILELTTGKERRG